MFGAPNPRSKLYTTFSAYTQSLSAMMKSWQNSDEWIENLEDTLTATYNVRHAIAMPMARVGIYSILKNLIRPGQKVILSPYTISDVVNMVLCAGGIPLFADIEKGGSYNIDPRTVENLISSNDDIGAVLVTHFYGLACDIMPILDLCNSHGIPVVEDAAQAFGTKVDRQLVGSIGHAGVFSFGLLKNITSFLGGAVLTSNGTLAEKIKADIQDFLPFPPKALLAKILKGASFDIATSPLIFDMFVYWAFRYAYIHNLDFFKNKMDTDSNPVSYMNFPDKYRYRMWDVQGKIVLEQLPRIDSDAAERIELAKIYDEGLKGLPEIVRPPLRTDGSHTYMYYPIHYRNRDALGQWMTKKFRDVQISHHRNCASMPCFSSYYRECPNAELAAQGVIYLPTYPGYGQDQAIKNIKSIHSYFRENRT